MSERPKHVCIECCSIGGTSSAEECQRIQRETMAYARGFVAGMEAAKRNPAASVSDIYDAPSTPALLPGEDVWADG